MPFRINRFEKGQFGFSFRLLKLLSPQPRLDKLPATRAQLGALLSSVSEITEIDYDKLKKIETFIATGQEEISTKTQNFNPTEAIKRAIKLFAWQFPLADRLKNPIERIKNGDPAEAVTFIPNLLWGATNAALNLGQMFFRLLSVPFDYAHRKINEMTEKSELAGKILGFTAQLLLFIPKQIIHRIANVIGYVTNLTNGLVQAGCATVRLLLSPLTWVAGQFSEKPPKFIDLIERECIEIGKGVKTASLNILRLLPETLLLTTCLLFPPAGTALGAAEFLTMTTLAMAPMSQLYSWSINEAGYHLLEDEKSEHKPTEKSRKKYTSSPSSQNNHRRFRSIREEADASVTPDHAGTYRLFPPTTPPTIELTPMTTDEGHISLLNLNTPAPGVTGSSSISHLSRFTFNDSPKAIAVDTMQTGGASDSPPITPQGQQEVEASDAQLVA